MKEKKKYLKMWYTSLYFLLGGVFFFFVGMYHTSTIIWWILCALMLGLFLRLYIPANKKIMCEGGYTIVDAVSFYNECRKAGCGQKFNQDICLKTAKRFNFSKELPPYAVRTLFETGEYFKMKRGKKK